MASFKAGFDAVRHLSERGYRREHAAGGRLIGKRPYPPQGA
jgi:hypothetical protein